MGTQHRWSTVSIMREVEVHLEMRLAAAMSELRVWLDHNNYVPVSFDICKEQQQNVLVRVVFAEDDVAVGEVEADVFPRERDVAYAIALFGIELGLGNLAREVGCGARIQCARRKQPDHQNTRHTHLV